MTAGVAGLGASVPPGGSGTDLAAEMVNLILARVAFVASARAFATAARMQHTLDEAAGSGRRRQPDLSLPFS